MKKDGGPAFPTDTLDGITLRDWFAGQALSGLCADPNSNLHSQDAICLTAWDLADIMLAERSKQ